MYLLAVWLSKHRLCIIWSQIAVCELCGVMVILLLSLKGARVLFSKL